MPTNPQEDQNNSASSSEQAKYYPYNVVPQVRSPRPSGKLPKFKCPPDNSQEFILIDNKNLSVVQGWETKTSLDLKDFFIPIESYQQYEFTLKTTSDFTKYTILNYGNIGDILDGTPFVMILPMYHVTELDDQNKWSLLYRFVDDPEWPNPGYSLPHDSYSGYQTGYSAADPYVWRVLGRIFMVHAHPDFPIRPIYLQNRTGVDIPVKIMIAN